MGLFDRKIAKVKAEDQNNLIQYSGMRLEVMDEEGALLFVARSSILWDGSMILQPITVPSDRIGSDGLAVTMRGYQETVKKAVHMSCRLTPFEDGGYKVEALEITSKDNDRAYYRQETAISGEVVPVRQRGMSEATCRLVNISAGGVCFIATAQYKVGDRLLLKTNLLPGVEMAPFLCAVRRANKKRFGYEYGCEFIQLDSGTEEMLAKAIMEMQRKRMNRR